MTPTEINELIPLPEVGSDRGESNDFVIELAHWAIVVLPVLVFLLLGALLIKVLWFGKDDSTLTGSLRNVEPGDRDQAPTVVK